MLDIFEKKNNTVAFVFMILAAFSWSLFGVISSIASTTLVPVILFVSFGHFFALILGLITSKLLKINLTETIRFFIKKQKIRKYLIWHSVFNLNLILFVAGYFLLTNKVIGVVISETAPIFMILASYVFFADSYQKDNTKLYTWTLIAFSLMGVVLLMLNGTHTNISEFYDYSVLGMVLMFLGAMIGGINSIVGNKIVALVKDASTSESISKIAIKTQFISRLSTMILYLFILLLAYAFNLLKLDDFSILLNKKVIILAFLFGLLTGYAQVILTRIAGNIATNHNIYLIWFLAPITGVILLWLLGYGEISPVIMLSLVLILVPNILLNLKVEESFSFRVTFVWILLFTLLLFYYPGVKIDSETYFNAANALLVFFALMVGYLINKLNERNNFREQLFMRFLHKIRADGVDEHDIEKISATFQQANNRLTDKVSAQLDGLEIKREKYSELLDFKFIQNRQLYNVGELFVLLLISLLLIGITTVYRENGFLYDSYSLIVNTAVVFTLAQVIEKMFFSEYQTRTPGRNIFMENVVGVLFLMILIVVIIILFLSKHNFNII